MTSQNRSWSQLRSDIGGAALLNRPGFLTGLPIVILASVLTANSRQEADLWLPWILANLLSVLVCWGWFELFERVIFAGRAKKPIAVGVVALFGLSLGALKGATTGIFGFLLGLETDLALGITSRIIQTALLGLWVVPVLAVLEATRRRFQAERDILVAERVQQRLAAADAQNTDVQNAEFISQPELRQFIGEAKKRLESESPQTYGPLIRDIVENALRPLSHRLWERENARVTNFSLADMSKIALVRYPFVVLPVTISYFGPVFFSLLAAVGVARAISTMLIEVLVLVTLLTAAKLYRPKNFAVAAGYFISVMALSVAAMALATSIIFSEPLTVAFLATHVVIFVWLSQVAFYSSFVLAAIRSHDKIREQLEELEQSQGNKGLNATVAKTENLILNRELANFLHGNLQNRLLSAALRMDKNQDNPDELLRELRAVEQLLDDAVLDYSQASGLGLAEQLAEIAARWAGFVSVQIDLQTSGASAVQIKQVTQLVNEAVSNAVRHGLAGKVWVSVVAGAGSAGGASGAAPQLLITVTDDGLGPRNGVAGLGSHLFESMAGTSWFLKPGTDGGSVLTLAIN